MARDLVIGEDELIRGKGKFQYGRGRIIARRDAKGPQGRGKVVLTVDYGRVHGVVEMEVARGKMLEIRDPNEVEAV